MLEYRIKIYPTFTGTEGESTYQTKEDLKGLIEIDIEPDKFVDEDFFAFEGKRAKLKVVPLGAFAEDILNKMNSKNMLQKQVPVPREGNEITTETVPTPYIDCRVEIFVNNSLSFVGIPDMSGYARDYKSGEATIELLSIYGLFFENIDDLSDLRIFNEQLTTPNPSVGNLLTQAIQYASNTPIQTGIDVGEIVANEIQINTPTRYYIDMNGFGINGIAQRFFPSENAVLQRDDYIEVNWVDKREVDSVNVNISLFVSDGTFNNTVYTDISVPAQYLAKKKVRFWNNFTIKEEEPVLSNNIVNADNVPNRVNLSNGTTIYLSLRKDIEGDEDSGYTIKVRAEESNYAYTHQNEIRLMLSSAIEQNINNRILPPEEFSSSNKLGYMLSGLSWRFMAENSEVFVFGEIDSPIIQVTIKEGGGVSFANDSNTIGLFNPDKHNFKDFIRTLLTISGKYMFFKNGKVLDFSKQISFSATGSTPLIKEKIISLKGKNSFRNLSKEFRDANFAETDLHWLVRLLIFWYRGQVGNIVQAIDLETLQTDLSVGDIVSHGEMVMYVNSVERKEDTLQCELLQINSTSEQKTLDKIPTNKLKWLTEVNSNDIEL